MTTPTPRASLATDVLRHVTPYTVNTMTLTAKSTVTDVDFGALFEKYGDGIREASDELEQPGDAKTSAEAPRVVFIVQRGRGGEVVQAGCVRKKNGRVKRYSPNVFENQATLVVRMPSGTHTNVKLFRNGHVQMTGSRSEKEGRMAAELVVSMASSSRVSSTVSTAASSRARAPRPDTGGAVDVAVGGAVEVDVAVGGAVEVDVAVGPVNVCLMNSDFRIIGGHVDRQALYEVATDVMGVQSSFQPAIYPAVKCFYMWRPETGDGSNRCLPYPRPGLAGPDRGMGPDLRPTAPDCDGVCPLHSAGGAGRGCDGKGCCKRVTILIFHTGATIVTGGVSENQIRACHEWVASLCAAHGRKFFL